MARMAELLPPEYRGVYGYSVEDAGDEVRMAGAGRRS